MACSRAPGLLCCPLGSRHGDLDSLGKAGGGDTTCYLMHELIRKNNPRSMQRALGEQSTSVYSTILRVATFVK